MSSASLDDFTLFNLGLPLHEEPPTTLDALTHPGNATQGSFGELAFDGFAPLSPSRPLPTPPRSFSGPPFTAAPSQSSRVVGGRGIGSSLGGFEGAEDGERGWFDLLGMTLPQDSEASRSLPSTFFDASSSLHVSPLTTFGNLSIFEPSLTSPFLLFLPTRRHPETRRASRMGSAFSEKSSAAGMGPKVAEGTRRKRREKEGEPRIVRVPRPLDSGRMPSSLQTRSFSLRKKWKPPIFEIKSKLFERRTLR